MPAESTTPWSHFMRYLIPPLWSRLRRMFTEGKIHANNSWEPGEPWIWLGQKAWIQFTSLPNLGRHKGRIIKKSLASSTSRRTITSYVSVLFQDHHVVCLKFGISSNDDQDASGETGIYNLPLNFSIIQICSVRRAASVVYALPNT